MVENFPVSASAIRTKYATVFELLVQLYHLYESGRNFTKYEDIVKLTEDMHEEAMLSDYLYENLKQAYDLYPTMLPGKVASGYKEDSFKEEERLKRIEALLNSLIKDLNEEIEDRAETIAERRACDLIDEDK